MRQVADSAAGATDAELLAAAARRSERNRGDGNSVFTLLQSGQWKRAGLFERQTRCSKLSWQHDWSADTCFARAVEFGSIMFPFILFLRLTGEC